MSVFYVLSPADPAGPPAAVPVPRAPRQPHRGHLPTGRGLRAETPGPDSSLPRHLRPHLPVVQRQDGADDGGLPPGHPPRLRVLPRA